MSSHTEDFLRNELEELKTGPTRFTLKLNSAKLDIPASNANVESLTTFERHITKLTVDTTKLGAAGKERQQRKQHMPREEYDSKVVADLVQSREIKAQLNGLFQDLEAFKGRVTHLEQVQKMGMSSLELLRLRSVSVCLSKQYSKRCWVIGSKPLTSFSTIIGKSKQCYWWLSQTEN
jgi:hypothetical protein